MHGRADIYEPFVRIIGGYTNLNFVYKELSTIGVRIFVAYF